MTRNMHGNESYPTEDPSGTPNRDVTFTEMQIIQHDIVESSRLAGLKIHPVDLASYLYNANLWLRQASQGVVPFGGCTVSRYSDTPVL